MRRDGGLLLLFFLLHGDRHGSVRRQADLVAFHLGDQALVDEVMMSPVAALAAVLLRQLDPAAFDLVHGADVDTVGADYFICS